MLEIKKVVVTTMVLDWVLDGLEAPGIEEGEFQVGPLAEVRAPEPVVLLECVILREDHSHQLQPLVWDHGAKRIVESEGLGLDEGVLAKGAVVLATQQQIALQQEKGVCLCHARS